MLNLFENTVKAWLLLAYLSILKIDKIILFIKKSWQILKDIKKYQLSWIYKTFQCAHNIYPLLDLKKYLKEEIYIIIFTF